MTGGCASRSHFDKAVTALEKGDTPVITTLDRLGRSTQNMMAFAEALRGRGAGLRVLNLGRGTVDTATPVGSMVFTVMTAMAQMELEIKQEESPTLSPSGVPLAKTSAGAGGPSPTPKSATPSG